MTMATRRSQRISRQDAKKKNSSTATRNAPKAAKQVKPKPPSPRRVAPDSDSWDSDGEPREYPRFGMPHRPVHPVSDLPAMLDVKLEVQDDDEILEPSPRLQNQNPEERARQPIANEWQMDLPAVPMPVGMVLPELIIVNSRLVNCEIKDMVLVNCQIEECKFINSIHYFI